MRERRAGQSLNHAGARFCPGTASPGACLGVPSAGFCRGRAGLGAVALGGHRASSVCGPGARVRSALLCPGQGCGAVMEMAVCSYLPHFKSG